MTVARFFARIRLKLFPALVLALSLFPPVSIADSSPCPTELRAAAALVRAGNYSQALAALGKLGGCDQEELGRARFLSGYCLYQLQRYPEAVNHLREASSLHPPLSFHSLFYGAAATKAAGDTPGAVSLFERLLKSNPPGDLRGRTLMELLRIQRQADDPAAAGEVLDRIRALARRDPAYDLEIDYTSAWIKSRAGAYEEARSLLVRLWKESPDCFWAEQAEVLLAQPAFWLPGAGSAFTEKDRLDRVRVLLEKGQGAQAVQELNPIVQLAETNASIAKLAALYKLRAQANEKKRAYNDAIADLYRAQQLLPSEDAEITYLIASCYHRSGREDEGLALYRELWTRSPRSPYASRALYYGARIMKGNNDWAGAEEAYRQLAAEYPASSFRPEALFQLAWMMYLQKDYAAALQFLEQSPLRSGDPEFNARTLYWRSVLLRWNGQPARAAEIEEYLLKNFWKTPYSFYLVMISGRPWTQPRGERPLPALEPAPPMEYRLAEELCRLGLEKEAQGQLLALENSGRVADPLAYSLSAMYLEADDYYRSQLTANRILNGRLNTPPPGELAAWRLAFPRAFPGLVETYADRFGLDPLLVFSLMRAESAYRPAIKSPAGALGLMQVMPETGRAIARGLNEKGYNRNWLLNPDTNVRYGCYYLGNRLAQFTGGAEREHKLMTVVKALASYNAGPERVKRWGDRADALGLNAAAFVEEIPIKETREYVKRILGFYFIYLNTYPSRKLESGSPDNPATPAAVTE
jgi:soluble lytic murein transglycosylase